MDMKKFVFLDFDGVMDTMRYDNWLIREGFPEADKYGVLFDPQCINNLDLIISATGAEIVITSSWKDWMTYGQLSEMWGERNLPGFLLDVTPTCSHHRGGEIKKWLELFSEYSKNEYYQYIIIDDLGEMDFNIEQRKHLIQVDPYFGLDEDATARAIEILNSDVPANFVVES